MFCFLACLFVWLVVLFYSVFVSWFLVSLFFLLFVWLVGSLLVWLFSVVFVLGSWVICLFVCLFGC